LKFSKISAIFSDQAGTLPFSPENGFKAEFVLEIAYLASSDLFLKIKRLPAAPMDQTQG